MLNYIYMYCLHLCKIIYICKERERERVCEKNIYLNNTQAGNQANFIDRCILICVYVHMHASLSIYIFVYMCAYNIHVQIEMYNSA